MHGGMGFLKRLFAPLPYDGAARLEFRDRNETLHYADDVLRADVQVSHGDARRIFPDDLAFETPTPPWPEVMRVFSNMLLCLSGRARRPVVVVLNVDDPRRERWQEACKLRTDVPIRFEETSDQAGFDLMLEGWIGALESGGGVQFGIDGPRAESRRDLEHEIERLRAEKRELRARQRAELAG